MEDEMFLQPYFKSKRVGIVYKSEVEHRVEDLIDCALSSDVALPIDIKVNVKSTCSWADSELTELIERYVVNELKRKGFEVSANSSHSFLVGYCWSDLDYLTLSLKFVGANGTINFSQCIQYVEVKR
ncbi:hypothetical protein [Thermosulfidibacter takaii]|nr:hypothetical protein [Thermosulfidibacter takaii]